MIKRGRPVRIEIGLNGRGRQIGQLAPDPVSPRAGQRYIPVVGQTQAKRRTVVIEPAVASGVEHTDRDDRLAPLDQPARHPIDALLLQRMGRADLHSVEISHVPIVYVAKAKGQVAPPPAGRYLNPPAQPDDPVVARQTLRIEIGGQSDRIPVAVVEGSLLPQTLSVPIRRIALRDNLLPASRVIAEPGP